MCLISNTIRPVINTSDIRCYKILVSIGNELQTPYWNFIFPLGEVIIDVEKEEISEASGKVVIQKGFFHSFTDLNIAKKRLEAFKRRFPENIIPKIYNAIIPAGTKYYIGEIEKDICSKSLKIIDQCND